MRDIASVDTGPRYYTAVDNMAHNSRQNTICPLTPFAVVQYRNTVMCKTSRALEFIAHIAHFLMDCTGHALSGRIMQTFLFLAMWLRREQ